MRSSYEGISRIEEYPYPESALREAVLNAVAHKDYGSGNPIQIKVYEDRIIIWNAGALPAELPVNKLLTNHPSIPFNPDVATTFFRAGLIEAWGRGTTKIIEECKAIGLPAPDFTNEFSGLQVTFKRGKGSVKTSGKTSGKMSGKTSGKILILTKENKYITIPEMAKNIGVAEGTIERNILKLKELSLIKRIGGAKGGYWETKEN